MSSQDAFNIVVVGSSGVGKSSMLVRLCWNEFRFETPTICTEIFTFQTTSSAGKKVHLELVDTAGQERFKSMVSNFYRRAQGGIVVFDLRNRQTFLDVREWIRELREKALNLRVMALVGNKLDWAAAFGRGVKTEEAQKLADLYNMRYFETSARTGCNIKAVMVHMADEISVKVAEQERMKATIRLHEEEAKKEETERKRNSRAADMPRSGCC